MAEPASQGSRRPWSGTLLGASWMLALLAGIVLAMLIPATRNGSVCQPPVSVVQKCKEYESLDHATPPMQATPSAVIGTSDTSDITVVVYTYNRPRMLLALLEDLVREVGRTNLTVSVMVLDDGSMGCFTKPVKDNELHNDHKSVLFEILAHSESASTSQRCSNEARFSLVRELVYARNWKLFSSSIRHGKKRYWHLLAQTYRLLKTEFVATSYVFLPDDTRLCQGFFELGLARWNGISDPSKITMMLHGEESRQDAAVWTPMKPRHKDQHIDQIGWVESGNFWCAREFLEFMSFDFPKIGLQRWVDNPPISSGVGATLSEKFFGARRTMYRTSVSLVAHVGVERSEMNTAERKKNPLRTIHFADGDEEYLRLVEEAQPITASMASTWTREQSLLAVVESLAPQVDHLNIYLNGYESSPLLLSVAAAFGWITLVHSWSESSAGDIGDAGKFFWASSIRSGYHLTCDDDIVYPPDYAVTMVSFLKLYENKVAVGVHGVIIKQHDLRLRRGYYASREVFNGFEVRDDSFAIFYCR